MKLGSNGGVKIGKLYIHTDANVGDPTYFEGNTLHVADTGSVKLGANAHSTTTAAAGTGDIKFDTTKNLAGSTSTNNRQIFNVVTSNSINIGGGTGNSASTVKVQALSVNDNSGDAVTIANNGNMATTTLTVALVL